MDWDQIESKWVAMTRRVRGDLSTDATGTLLRRSAKADAMVNKGAERQPNVTTEQQSTLPAQ